jgi:outer membrane biosynthesis protein TonB
VTNDQNVDFGIIACRRSMPQVQRVIDYMEVALADLEDAAGLATPKAKSKPTSRAKPKPKQKAKPKPKPKQKAKPKAKPKAKRTAGKKSPARPKRAAAKKK